MVTVLIAGHTRIYREGLAAALSNCPSLVIVGTVATVEEALLSIGQRKPDAVLVDTVMEGAMHLVAAAGDVHPATRVIALAVADVDTEIVAWAEAGVAAFVTRENSLDDLIGAVIASANGELACSPRLAATLLKHVASLAARRTAPLTTTQLTKRQSYILELVSDGLSNKEIARALGIEVATVKNHVHQLLGKLNVKRRGEAAALTRRQGCSVLSTSRCMTGRDRD